jgi:hypothetical protein
MENIVQNSFEVQMRLFKMIYITGDLHGGSTSAHITSASFPQAKQGDIVLCCGDFGAVWYHDYHINGKHRREENGFLEMRLRQRILWLAVDGNHENFARLFGGEFPLVELYGGRAYKIRENVYYLKRGDIFTISGRTFLAFGGARSQDKEPGTITNLYGKVKPWNGRTEGKNWWPEEIPCHEDFENACRNLDAVGWKVDYALTHTCPISQRTLFTNAERLPDPVEIMLQDLLGRGLVFTEWHFGHFHMEKQVDRFKCHYNRVQRLF